MLDMLARRIGKRLARQTLAHGLPEDPQTVQLVVGLEQIDALRLVIRQIHGIGPVLALRPLPVHSYEAM